MKRKLTCLAGVLTIVGMQLACAAQPAPPPPQPPQPPKPATAPKTWTFEGKDVILQTAPRVGDGRVMRMNLKPGVGKTEPGPYLGISATPVTGALRSQLKLRPGVGLVVEHVDKDSPAAAAGVEQFDVLQQLNDQILIDPRQLGVLVRLQKAGDEVTLKLLRSGEQRTVTAKLTEKELPPLDGEGSAWRAVNGLLELKGDQIMLDRSPQPLSRVFDVLRKQDGTDVSMEYSEKGMTLQITREGGKSHLVAKDAAGKVLFDGPINTEEERKALPEEVAKRLKTMEGPAAGEAAK